jgi:hypothetical protein
MIISKTNNITVLTQERASIPELVLKINDSYGQIKNDNIVLNLTSLKKLSVNDIVEFLQISNTHRSGKHSFVIVNNTIDVDETPEEIIVVPTLQEAFDIIEMEEMERDLGL